MKFRVISETKANGREIHLIEVSREEGYWDTYDFTMHTSLEKALERARWLKDLNEGNKVIHTAYTEV